MQKQLISDNKDDNVEEMNELLIEALEKVGGILEQQNSILKNSVRNVKSNLVYLKARKVKLAQFKKEVEMDIKNLKKCAAQMATNAKTYRICSIT